MTTKSLISVDEYLHTSFDGCDCEDLDGEIVERNMGESEHRRIQRRLIILLSALNPEFDVIPEIRMRMSTTRYRISDVGVWFLGQVTTPIPTVPPFLAIEILSTEDRMTRMKKKIEEYLALGVQWIWVIDPEERNAIAYSQHNPAGSFCEVLRTENPAIAIPLDEVLPPAA